VRRFLERLARLSADEWSAAARVYAAGWRDPASARADAALADAVARTGRERARDQLVGPVLQMARAVATPAAGGAPPAARRPVPPAEDALAEAALAAALAVLARDALPADAYERLVAPFADAAESDEG
jgi:hypothetical protein